MRINATTLEEFNDAVRRHKPQDFLHYYRLSQKKRAEVTSLMAVIGMDSMRGMRCLDIGPGCGDSLDIWRERGR